MTSKKADTKGQREEKNVLDELLGTVEEEDDLDISEPSLLDRKYSGKKRHLQIEINSFTSKNGSETVCTGEMSSDLITCSPTQPTKRIRSTSVVSAASECSLPLSEHSNLNVNDDSESCSCSCEGHGSIASDSESDTRSYSLHSSSSSVASPTAKVKLESKRSHAKQSKHNSLREKSRKRRSPAGSSRKHKKHHSSSTLNHRNLESSSAAHDNSIDTRKPDESRSRANGKRSYDEGRQQLRRRTASTSDRYHSHEVANFGHFDATHSNHHADRSTERTHRRPIAESTTNQSRDHFAEPMFRSIEVNFESLLRHFFKDAAFFVMKSSNFENIDLSKRLSVWSTRPANEQKLNRAFTQFHNVILLFSVQESGHFQGFARLTSCAIHDGPPVPWLLPPGVNPNALGGTFTLDWLNTNHLPFNRTLHLFNPLNDGKPVKVARDGQQVEPRVGQELCRLFSDDLSSDLISKLRRMRQQVANRQSLHRSNSYHELNSWNGNNYESKSMNMPSSYASRYQNRTSIGSRTSSIHSNGRSSSSRFAMGGVAEFKRAFSSLGTSSQNSNRNTHVLNRIHTASNRRFNSRAANGNSYQGNQSYRSVERR